MPARTPSKIVDFDAGAAGLGRGVVRVPESAPSAATSPDLERLFAAADYHGEVSGETEQAIGDLQGVLRSCWRLLLPEQQRQVLHEQQELLGMWDPTEER